MRSTHRVFALALAALCGAATACSSEKSIPSDGYFVVRYNANTKERLWVPVGERHGNPPESAAMVVYEITRHAFQNPTQADQEEAAELIWACERAYEKHGWLDFDTAIAGGFEKLYGDELHYVNPEYLFDDRILDCEHPEFLLYDPVDHHLLGFMFLARTLEEHGPQPGGPLTVWHYHLWAHPRCVEKELWVVGVVDEEGECASGKASRRSPEMMHVWMIDHPHGRFATRMGPGKRTRPSR